MCQPCAMLELWFFMTVITQDVPTVTTGEQCIEIMGCFVQASTEPPLFLWKGVVSATSVPFLQKWVTGGKDKP